jgi:hypothetical protein
MNKEDLKAGDVVRVSYTIAAGPDAGTFRTGIGYISPSVSDPGRLRAGIAWSHGGVSNTNMDFIHDGVEIEIINVVTPKAEHSPDWRLQDYIPIPQKRETYERLESISWDDVTKYLFGGHLEPGDVIANSDYSEVFCLSHVEQSNIKGHKLLKNGKWSPKKSNIYGIGIGYHKMKKEKF